MDWKSTIGRARVLIVMLVLVVPAVSHADTVTFELGDVFDGKPDPTPTTPPPWLVATFDDAAAGLGDNQVALHLDTRGLADNWMVQDWYFNFREGLDPAKLSISGIPETSVGLNSLSVPGDHGVFDFKLNGWQGPELEANKVATYTLTYDDPGATLAASDFDYLALGGAGYYSAAHIGGLGANNEDSTSIGAVASGSFPGGGLSPVPEPTTLVLLGSGLLGLATVARRGREASA